MEDLRLSTHCHQVCCTISFPRFSPWWQLSPSDFRCVAVQLLEILHHHVAPVLFPVSQKNGGHLCCISMSLWCFFHLGGSNSAHPWLVDMAESSFTVVLLVCALFNCCLSTNGKDGKKCCITRVFSPWPKAAVHLLEVCCVTVPTTPNQIMVFTLVSSLFKKSLFFVTTLCEWRVHLGTCGSHHFAFDEVFLLSFQFSQWWCVSSRFRSHVLFPWWRTTPCPWPIKACVGGSQVSLWCCSFVCTTIFRQLTPQRWSLDVAPFRFRIPTQSLSLRRCDTCTSANMVTMCFVQFHCCVFHIGGSVRTLTSDAL